MANENQECCATLDNIKRHCGANLAGLKNEVKIICIDDVICIPEKEEGTHLISSNIPVKSCYSWTMKKNSGSYVAEKQDDGSYLSRVEMFFPFLCPESTHILNNANGEYLLQACDKNGQRRLLGDIEDGVSLDITEQSNDENGYLVVATWVSSLKPCFVSSTSEYELFPTPIITVTP